MSFLLMSLNIKYFDDNHQSSHYWSIKYHLTKYIQIEINKEWKYYS